MIPKHDIYLRLLKIIAWLQIYIYNFLCVHLANKTVYTLISPSVMWNYTFTVGHGSIFCIFTPSFSPSMNMSLRIFHLWPLCPNDSDVPDLHVRKKYLHKNQFTGPVIKHYKWGESSFNKLTSKKARRVQVYFVLVLLCCCLFLLSKKFKCLKHLFLYSMKMKTKPFQHFHRATG